VEYLNDSDIIMEQLSGAYHFSSDAVALGNFVRCKRTDTVIDIGCGTGILTLLIAGTMFPEKIIAVDINTDAVNQMETNIGLNKTKLSQTKFTVDNTDARTLHTITGANIADVIVCNPPYFTTGKKSVNPDKSAARHDDTLSLSDLAVSATKLLKYGGTIYFCYPSNNTAKVIAIFENNNFRVKEIKFISNEKGIYLALFKCKKGGGHNTIVTLA